LASGVVEVVSISRMRLAIVSDIARALLDASGFGAS
jgi:hypothetical protein